MVLSPLPRALVAIPIGELAIRKGPPLEIAVSPMAPIAIEMAAGEAVAAEVMPGGLRVVG